MGRTQAKTTSFADRLVEWFVPDREAMAKAIHKLLWEKGNGGPLPLGKLEHKSETGLQAPIRYMSYRVGGYRHETGNAVSYRAPYFTARWVRGQGLHAPEGSLSVNVVGHRTSRKRAGAGLLHRSLPAGRRPL